MSILFQGCGTTREADQLLEQASLEGLDVSSLRITSADSLPWTSNVTVAPPHERVLEGGGVHVVSSSTGVFRCPRNDTAVNVEAMLADVEQDGYALFTEDFAGRRALKTVYDYLLKLQDVGLVYEVQQTYCKDGCVLLSCKKGAQAATAATLEPPRVELAATISKETIWLDAFLAQGVTMRICSHFGVRFKCHCPGNYLLEDGGVVPGCPPHDLMPFFKFNCYAGSTRCPWRRAEESRKRALRFGLAEKGWKCTLVWQFAFMHPETRAFIDTIELLDFVNQWAETQELHEDEEMLNINVLKFGFHKASAHSNLLNGLFTGLLDLNTVQSRLEEIEQMPFSAEYKHWLRELVEKTVQKLAVFSGCFDLSTLDSRHKMIDELHIDEAQQQQLHDALDLTTQKAAAMQGTYDGKNLERNNGLIDALPIKAADKAVLRGKMQLTTQKAAAMQGTYDGKNLERNNGLIDALPIKAADKAVLRGKMELNTATATAFRFRVGSDAPARIHDCINKLPTNDAKKQELQGKATKARQVNPLLTAVNAAWTAVVTLDRVIAVVRDGDGKDWHELTEEAAMRENYSRGVSVWITAVGSREKAFGRIDYYILNHQDTQMKEKAELLKEQLRLFLKQDDTRTRKRPQGYDSNAARNARRKHEQDQPKIVPTTQPSVCGWACGNEDACTQAKDNSQTACSSKPACGEDTATHSRAATTKRAQPHPATTRKRGMFTSDIQTPKVVVSSKRPADVACAAPPAIDVVPQVYNFAYLSFVRITLQICASSDLCSICRRTPLDHQKGLVAPLRLMQASIMKRSRATKNQRTCIATSI
jgi:hypothetical protein